MSQLLRILGIIVLVSYTTVIMATWIAADAQGYTYFSAGEPNGVIRYVEWLLGLFGIMVAVRLLHSEINSGKSD